MGREPRAVRNRAILAATVLLVLPAAGGALAQAGPAAAEPNVLPPAAAPSAPEPSVAASVPAAGFLRQVRANNALAIKAAHEALVSSTDNRVRAFARQVETHRAAIDKKFAAAAGPAAWLAAEKAADVDSAADEGLLVKLRSAATGGWFDQSFLRLQSGVTASLSGALQAFGERGAPSPGIDAAAVATLRGQARGFARQAQADLSRSQMLLRSEPPAPARNLDPPPLRRPGIPAGTGRASPPV